MVHEYMHSKFEGRYTHGCSHNGHEDKDNKTNKSKVANTDSNIDTINKWRQVIDNMQEC